MTETAFSDNYNDLSTNLGFQFEFYCERCHDAFRSEFAYHKLGVAAKLLSILSSFTGGILSSIGWRSGELAEIGHSQARDAAFRHAIAQAKDHFHRCPRCGNYACGKCWNEDEEICAGCAPLLQGEISAAKRAAAIEQVNEEARQIKHVTREQVAKKQKSACPECGQPAGGGKFCQHCGASLVTQKACPTCSARLEGSARFCPECGAAVTA